MPGRNITEKRRVEGEEEDGGEERRIRDQIVKEVIAGIQEKKVFHEGVKHKVKRRRVQSFMRSWNCLQIEEAEESFQEKD